MLIKTQNISSVKNIKDKRSYKVVNKWNDVTDIQCQFNEYNLCVQAIQGSTLRRVLSSQASKIRPGQGKQNITHPVGQVAKKL